jgi:hypothetical protein
MASFTTKSTAHRSAADALIEHKGRAAGDLYIGNFIAMGTTVNQFFGVANEEIFIPEVVVIAPLEVLNKSDSTSSILPVNATLKLTKPGLNSCK